MLLGDTLYYINTGTAKSHGDLKTTDKVKMTKNRKTFISKKAFTIVEKIVELNCKLIDPSIIEKDFELIKELEMLKRHLLLKPMILIILINLIYLLKIKLKKSMLVYLLMNIMLVI
jgi:hypothetical protein